MDDVGIRSTCFYNYSSFAVTGHYVILMVHWRGQRGHDFVLSY